MWFKLSPPKLVLSTFEMHAPSGRLTQWRLSIWLDMAQASDSISESAIGTSEVLHNLSEYVPKFTQRL